MGKSHLYFIQKVTVGGGFASPARSHGAATAAALVCFRAASPTAWWVPRACAGSADRFASGLRARPDLTEF